MYHPLDITHTHKHTLTHTVNSSSPFLQIGRSLSTSHLYMQYETSNPRPSGSNMAVNTCLKRSFIIAIVLNMVSDFINVFIYLLLSAFDGMFWVKSLQPAASYFVCRRCIPSCGASVSHPPYCCCLVFLFHNVNCEIVYLTSNCLIALS